jgi:MFS family permease
VARDPRHARVAVFYVFFAHGALFASWAARLPALREELALSEAELGIALLGLTLGAIAGLPLAGWLVSREGSRRTVAQGLPVLALLLPCLALAPSLVLLVLAAAAFGIAGGAVDVAMNAHGFAVERLYERPILASFHAGFSLGGLAGAGAAALAAAGGVEPLAHFVAAAAALGAGGLLAARALLPAEADRPEKPVRFARPPRRLLPLALLAFCGLFGEAAVEGWSAVYLADELGAAAGTAALGIAVFSIAMATGRLTGDRLTVKLGPVTLTRAGGVAASGGLALALAVGTPAVALIGLAVMGIGLATLVPIAFRAAGSFPGLTPGQGIAALTTVGYGAFVASPPLIGVVADATSLSAALWIVVGLAALLVFFAPATAPAESAGEADA